VPENVWHSDRVADALAGRSGKDALDAVLTDWPPR